MQQAQLKQLEHENTWIIFIFLFFYLQDTYL